MEGTPVGDCGSEPKVELQLATMPSTGGSPPGGMHAPLLSGFPVTVGFMAPPMGLAPGLVGAGSGGGVATSGGVPDSALFALAQLAEESAQMASSASAFCANPQDLSQVVAVAEAAEQAAQRAQWAAKVVTEIGAPENSQFSQHDEWLVTMRKITTTAAEVAQQCSEVCSASREEVEKVLPSCAEKRSKVPCRHFMETGMCREGASCRFSHDPKDQKPRPLMLKRQEECKFFSQGKCIRGAACAWAHGSDELAEITKYVSRLRDEKFQLRRAGRAGPGRIKGPYDEGC
eukprot:TRINITY_DN61213_c0_g1_i1.p1 TRINITY_DN61213_c0_g1~~TRINITY_DN61213_c0_g1_i1.p1  ORF type:complete len:323 (-),score=86.49 TRINITY_DN61213_c0_g1_i1:37-900(-)